MCIINTHYINHYVNSVLENFIGNVEIPAVEMPDLSEEIVNQQSASNISYYRNAESENQTKYNEEEHFDLIIH